MIKRSGGSRRPVPPLFWFFLFLIIWEAAARTGFVSNLVLPTVSSVISGLFTAPADGHLILSIGISLVYVFSGMAAGSAAAFVLASAAFRFKPVNSLFQMLSAVFHPLPGIALLPVLILFFGIGPVSLLMVIIHSVLWPLAVNLAAGFTAVPAVYRKIGANYSLSSASFFFRIMLPASFPYILAGMKTAWARAWRAVVSAEMIFGITGDRGGLGWFIYSRRIFMDTRGMYAGLLAIAVLGLFIESFLFDGIELFTIRKWEGV